MALAAAAEVTAVSVWLLALATVLAPWCLGAALAAALRRRTARGRALAASLAVAALCVGTSFGWLPQRWVSVYDHLCMTALFALGVVSLWVRRETDWINPVSMALSAVVCVVGGVGLELEAREIPTAPLPRPPVEEMHMVFGPASRDRRCGPLFPTFVEGYGYERVAREVGLVIDIWRGFPPRAGARRVLHIGDSLIATHREVVVTQRLESLRPREAHMNTGLGGFGPDAYFMVGRRYVPLLRPAEVVVHVFLGNDFTSDGYLCCEDQPLVTVSGDRASPRCESPRWSTDAASRWAVGPTPLALRVLSTVSVAAARFGDRAERGMREAAARRAGDTATRPAPHGTSERLQTVALLSLAESLRARGVPTTVVLIPPRASVESDDPSDPYRALRDRVAAALRARSIRCVDLWADLAAAARAPSPTFWFSPTDHQDSHFDDDGHRFYARWLNEHVFDARDGAP